MLVVATPLSASHQQEFHGGLRPQNPHLFYFR